MLKGTRRDAWIWTVTLCALLVASSGLMSAQTVLTAVAVTATDANGTPCSYGSPTCTYPYYWTTWGDYHLYLQTSGDTQNRP